MSSLRLHKKYGLNPTLSTCFYCGKETGEIALLGANYNGEAPMHLCTSLEPCHDCKERFKDQVLIVEADLASNGEPIPTGRFVAIPKQMVNTPNKGICLMYPEEFTKMFRR